MLPILSKDTLLSQAQVSSCTPRTSLAPRHSSQAQGRAPLRTPIPADLAPGIVEQPFHVSLFSWQSAYRRNLCHRGAREPCEVSRESLSASDLTKVGGHKWPERPARIEYCWWHSRRGGLHGAMGDADVLLLERETLMCCWCRRRLEGAAA